MSKTVSTNTNTNTPAPTRTMRDIKGMFPECFGVTPAEVFRATKRADRIELTARLMAGLALEWAISGSDAGVKANRVAVPNKGTGRVFHLALSETVRGKARALASASPDVLESFVLESVAIATDALTPPAKDKGTVKAPATDVSGAVSDAPAPAKTPVETSASADPEDIEETVASIIAMIDAGTLPGILLGQLNHSIRAAYARMPEPAPF
jgi:hypothetical protein